MKKIILALAILITIGLTSCNYCTRNFGGYTEVRLEPGEKLVEVTWKDANLWYLVGILDGSLEPKYEK